MSSCLKCGNSLPERAGAGRPAIYCGVGCRRAVEYEVRRLSRRIERLEEIQAELARRGALPAPEPEPEPEPCELSAELAEVAAELRRRDEERAELKQRLAEVEADPRAAILAAIDRLAAALAVVLQPARARWWVKTVERDSQGNITRIIEEQVA